MSDMLVFLDKQVAAMNQCILLKWSLWCSLNKLLCLGNHRSFILFLLGRINCNDGLVPNHRLWGKTWRRSSDERERWIKNFCAGKEFHISRKRILFHDDWLVFVSALGLYDNRSVRQCDDVLHSSQGSKKDLYKGFLENFRDFFGKRFGRKTKEML